MPRLLIVDDDLSLREFLTIFLRKEGYEVEVASNGQKALEFLDERPFDIVLTDLRMPRMGGLELLDAIRERKIPTQIVMMTAYSSTDTALDAMRKGAYDYITKPFQLQAVKVVLQKCLENGALVAENLQLKKKLATTQGKRATFVYKSAAMDEVLRLVKRVAPTPSTVLVSGESGTGKELVARMLHWDSQRAERAFIAINCGAIPEPLMESELFGHVKGSFTGATRDKKGLFEAAHGGTIFLDEIGELSQNLQVKLLRVLQERVVTPVGGTQEIAIDVRVVAATHQNLRDLVQQGRFRADLFYRLNVIELRMPALRQRREDILPLAQYFLTAFCQRLGRDIRGFEPEAEAVLEALPYAGNVRELENIVERAVALETADRITPTYLPDPGSVELLAHAGPGGDAGHALADAEPHVLVDRAVLGIDRWLGREDAVVDSKALGERFERGLLDAALRHSGGSKTDAARRLGLTFRSLRYLVQSKKVAGEPDAADP